MRIVILVKRYWYFQQLQTTRVRVVELQTVMRVVQSMLDLQYFKNG